MAIEIKNITKKYGDLTALDNVSITFEENKIYGLLGNNGAGKTTLLSIITNRTFPTDGQVLIDGESNLSNDSALGKLFLMSEDNMYPEDMRVHAALKTAAMFYPNFDMDYANSLVQQFGLNQKKKITSLSTGYRSVFRLIIALSANTPYVLLDEPVLGLDARFRDMFYKALLEKYAEKPFTAIISTHLISEAAPLIEHAVIIRQGKVLADEKTYTLLSGYYSVSGPSNAVDNCVSGLRVLSQSGMGGLKSAIVQGRPENVVNGIEVAPIQLQDYFISLMNEEEGK